MIDFYSGCDLIRNSDTGLLVNKTFDINGWGKFTSFGLRIFFCWLRCKNYIRHRYILQSAAQLCKVFLLLADFVYVTDKVDLKTDKIRVSGHNVLSYIEGGRNKIILFSNFLPEWIFEYCIQQRNLLTSLKSGSWPVLFWCQQVTEDELTIFKNLCYIVNIEYLLNI